jgi:hypothetical protein
MTTKKAASHLHDNHTGLYPVTNILYVFKTQPQVKMSSHEREKELNFPRIYECVSILLTNTSVQKKRKEKQFEFK